MAFMPINNASDDLVHFSHGELVSAKETEHFNTQSALLKNLETLL